MRLFKIYGIWPQTYIHTTSAMQSRKCGALSGPPPKKFFNKILSILPDLYSKSCAVSLILYTKFGVAMAHHACMCVIQITAILHYLQQQDMLPFPFITPAVCLRN